MEIGRYESNGRFCQAVSYNGLLFLSGFVDIEQDTFEGQARSVFAKIDTILEKYGSSRDLILSANVYLKAATMVDVFNGLWLEWVVAGCEPVRTTIAAEMVHPAVLVEITVVAAVSDKE